jgi:phospholipid/cholesterol/gamma-HCH transport system permease protein
MTVMGPAGGRKAPLRSPSESVRRTLARLGRGVRRRVRFVLSLSALAFAVMREAMRRDNWRRTVRAEFRRVLRQAVGGGLAPTLVTGALLGLAMVSQTLYWLAEAGQGELIGSVLVTVIVRELTPLLVGFILLGHSGMVALSEVATLRRGGQVEALAAQGLDPFLFLVLPRAWALAISAFTLAVLLVPVALVTGFVASSLLGAVETTVWTFLDGVLRAMRTADFAVFPAKMLTIGLLVALTAVLTGLDAGVGVNAAQVLPRGFVRGTIAILVVTITLSFAV